VSARLLLYLAHAGDVQRFAVAPTLAALAEQAAGDWRFDCTFDAPRDGRHFGAGDPQEFGRAAGNGSLLAGGVATEQLLWLADAYDVFAVGDPRSPAWPLLDAAGAVTLCRSGDAAEVYGAVLGELELPGARRPRRLIVVDGSPQGRHGVVVAPYVLPAAFVDGPALLLDVTSTAATVDAVVELLAQPAAPPFALYADPSRADAFPIELADRHGAVGDATYTDVTAELARRHASWGRGVLLGDPTLVGAQAAKAARLRLLPVHGRPQVDAIARLDDIVRTAREPVYGRQWDDRDFFALARAGHGLQVVDPPPPFDGITGTPLRWASAAEAAGEPDDDQLARWAREGRVLTTLLFWVGMVREADCYPALFGLLSATGLRAGAVVTVDAIAHAPRAALALLTTPVDRGGAHGLAELLVGSTGFGVAAEAELPDGALARSLADARHELDALLPESLRPRGWWPLLDTTMRAHPVPRIGWRNRRPVVHLRPGRSLLRAAVNRTKAYRWVEEQRPYDDARPGAIAPAVVSAVRAAGFDHMWTKAAFGTPRIAHADSDGEFVALTFTAGNWDGWSPFYTVSSVADLAAAERRLTATGEPGWLVSTVDAPLWLLTGERQRHGAWLHEAATALVAGGRTGRLVNVTPSVVARYARLVARARPCGS
jgi:hypothetical protein